VSSAPEERWRHHPPPGGHATPGWLRQLASFRGEVLYAGGRRPHLAREPEARDRVAHHVVVELDGRLRGCWRLLPLTPAIPGLCAEAFGAEALGDLLRERDLEVALVGEGGGWAVDPALRGRKLGLRLWAAGAALAAHLGLRAVVAAIGTREGQAAAIQACGAELVEQLGTRAHADLDDDLTLGVHRVGQESPMFRPVVNSMSGILGFTQATAQR